MSREEAVEILSEMRADYNLFGDEEEATRYHVLSWAIQATKDTRRWIPIKTRPMDKEERAEWSEKLGYDIEDEDTATEIKFLERLYEKVGADIRGEEV